MVITDMTIPDICVVVFDAGWAFVRRTSRHGDFKGKNGMADWKEVIAHANESSREALTLPRWRGGYCSIH
jgi:hypothetical protein